MWDEIVTVLALVGLASLCVVLLPAEAKDVVIAVTSGLLGYLTRGVKHGQEGKGKEEQGQGQE